MRTDDSVFSSIQAVAGGTYNDAGYNREVIIYL